MKIRDVLKEQKRTNNDSNHFGTYIGVTIDYQSRTFIETFCKDFNLRAVNQEDLHIPLCVSQNNIFGKKEKTNIIWRPFVLDTFQIQQGKNQNQDDILYLSFESEELEEARNELIRKYEINDIFENQWEPYLIFTQDIDTQNIKLEKLTLNIHEYIDTIYTEELFKEPLEQERVDQFRKKKSQQKNKKL